MFAVAMVMGLLGVAIDRRTTALDLRTRPPLRGAAWIASLTFTIGSCVSFATSSAFQSRYSAVIFPFLALLAAAGCVCFASHWIRFCVVAVFCSFLAVGAFGNVNWERTELKLIADAVRDSSEEGDIVVFCPDQLGPAGSRVMPSGLTLVSYPKYDDGKFVDWVDYAERNAASEPDVFAARLLADAGSSRSIYLVTNGSYKTFEGKCETLLSSLAAVRTPETIVIDSDNFYERAALYVFAAPA
jgi:hypothetical protein